MMYTLELVFEQVVSGSLRASAMIVAILTLRWLLRGQLPAQCFHVLWLLVSVRLLMPIAPSSPTSVFNLLRKDHEQRANDGGATSWVARLKPMQAHDMKPVAVEQPVAAPHAAHSPGYEMRSLLSLAWGVGVSVCVGFLGLSGWRMRRMLANAGPVQDARVPGLLRECAVILGLKREVRFCESKEIRAPAVAGIWNSRVVLPLGFAGGLSDGQLKMVLLHECAHLRRRDLAAMWLATMARVVHWFNPLAWLAWRAARTDAEFACDETVLHRTGDEVPPVYGETLLQLSQSLAWRPSAVPVAGIFESRRAMYARVANIARYSRPAGRRVSFAALLVVGVGVVFAVDESPKPGTDGGAPSDGVLTVPVHESAADTNEAKPPSTAQQVEISARFIQTTDTAIRRIRAQGSGISRLQAALRDGSAEMVLTPVEAEDIQRNLTTRRQTDLLSSPRVTTKSGQRAVIEIIREWKYPVRLERDETKKVWVPKEWETRNVGTTLEAEPALNGDGTIQLHLRPVVVELLGFRVEATGRVIGLSKSQRTGPRFFQSGPFPAVTPDMDERGVRPVFSSRERDLVLNVRPGETVLFVNLPEAEEVAPFTSPAKSRRLMVLVTAQVVNETGEPKPKKTGQVPPVKAAAPTVAK